MNEAVIQSSKIFETSRRLIMISTRTEGPRSKTSTETGYPKRRTNRRTCKMIIKYTLGQGFPRGHEKCIPVIDDWATNRTASVTLLWHYLLLALASTI